MVVAVRTATAPTVDQTLRERIAEKMKCMGVAKAVGFHVTEKATGVKHMILDH